MKYLISISLAALGILAIFADAAKLLPPDFGVPAVVVSFLTALPLLLGMFGLLDEFDEGAKAIREILQRFVSDPYRSLAVSVMLSTANGIIAVASSGSTAWYVAHVFVALLNAGFFGVGIAKVYARRELLKLARLNKFKVL